MCRLNGSPGASSTQPCPVHWLLPPHTFGFDGSQSTSRSCTHRAPRGHMFVSRKVERDLFVFYLLLCTANRRRRRPTERRDFMWKYIALLAYSRCVSFVLPHRQRQPSRIASCNMYHGIMLCRLRVLFSSRTSLTSNFCYSFTKTMSRRLCKLRLVPRKRFTVQFRGNDHSHTTKTMCRLLSVEANDAFSRTELHFTENMHIFTCTTYMLYAVYSKVTSNTKRTRTIMTSSLLLATWRNYRIRVVVSANVLWPFSRETRCSLQVNYTSWHAWHTVYVFDGTGFVCSCHFQLSLGACGWCTNDISILFALRITLVVATSMCTFKRV